MSGQAGASAGAPGGGVRVTVPVSLAPDEAARDLAPRLRAADAALMAVAIAVPTIALALSEIGGASWRESR